MTESGLDADLEDMGREHLILEVERLRAAIRKHRDASGHDLCWWHPQLWGVLPEATDPLPEVPDWPRFMEGCVRFRASLDSQAPEAPRVNTTFGDNG